MFLYVCSQFLLVLASSVSRYYSAWVFPHMYLCLVQLHMYNTTTILWHTTLNILHIILYIVVCSLPNALSVDAYIFCRPLVCFRSLCFSCWPYFVSLFSCCRHHWWHALLWPTLLTTHLHTLTVTLCKLLSSFFNFTCNSVDDVYGDCRLSEPSFFASLYRKYSFRIFSELLFFCLRPQLPQFDL